MDKLDQLYRQVIMEHYKNPKNKGLINDDRYIKVHLDNPNCGDKIDVQVLLEDGQIKDIRHDGKGCSLCMSSASIMSELVKKKTLDRTKKIMYEFYDMMLGKEVSDEDLDEAIVYKSVSNFPARIKCVTLSWKALEEAIEEGEKDGEGQKK